MQPSHVRMTIRLLHLILGACVAAIVYLPLAWSEPIRFTVGAVVVPAVVLTGLTLWQLGRIRRHLGRRRRLAEQTQ